MNSPTLTVTGLLTCLLLPLLVPPCSAKETAIVWPAITAEQHEAKAPLLEEEAAAETLDRTLSIDDSDCPEVTILHDFRRFKIYRPDKAEDIARISTLDNTTAGELKRKLKSMAARIVYPDGRILEYGEKDLHERAITGQTAQRSFLERMLNGEEGGRKEHFLALGALEQGCIVDVDIVQEREGVIMAQAIPLEQLRIPTRHSVFIYKAPDSRYNYMISGLNSNFGDAKLTEDRKHRTARLESGPLPALRREPFCPPMYDSGLSALICLTRIEKLVLTRNTQERITSDPKKDGPWSTVATERYIELHDRSEPTRRIRELAASLTANLTDPMEKARAIHNQVCVLHKEFLKIPRDKSLELIPSNFSQSLDDVLDYPKKRHVFDLRSDDFLYLALALYKCAGLETKMLLLPNASLMRFRRAVVTPATLGYSCAVIRIGDGWVYSRPHDIQPMQLGFLPGDLMGQGGLVVKEGPEEFMDVPPMASKYSVQQNVGVLILDSNGNLSGDSIRRCNGQVAWEYRRKLLGKTLDEARNFFRRQLETDIPGAEITIGDIQSLEDRDKVLAISYHMNLPGFATLTKNRILLRPSVFRLKADSPFSASRRTLPVLFPFPWQESDKVQIFLPGGYTPDLKDVPKPLSSSEVVHRCTLSYDPATHLLQVLREFGLRGSYVPVDKYPTLKDYFDQIASSDAFEISLGRDEPVEKSK